jgi:hypothetical protein
MNLVTIHERINKARRPVSQRGQPGARVARRPTAAPGPAPATESIHPGLACVWATGVASFQVDPIDLGLGAAQGSSELPAGADR